MEYILGGGSFDTHYLSSRARPFIGGGHTMLLCLAVFHGFGNVNVFLEIDETSRFRQVSGLSLKTVEIR